MKCYLSFSQKRIINTAHLPQTHYLNLSFFACDIFCVSSLSGKCGPQSYQPSWGKLPFLFPVHGLVSANLAAHWWLGCLSSCFFFLRHFLVCQGSYRSWKTWKVMEFQNFIFQAWKVMEFNCRSWKVMESDKSEDDKAWTAERHTFWWTPQFVSVELCKVEK